MNKLCFYKETKLKPLQIGEVSQEWDIKSLKEVTEKIQSGGTPKTTIRKYYENGNIPFVKIEDITSSNKYLIKTITKITEEGLKNSSAWLVPKNSLLLALYGSLGEVSINKIEVTTNQAILGIIPKKMVNLEFLYYWYFYFKPKWKTFAKTTTQANLTKEIIKNSLIPLPPLAEQKAIVQVLKDIDDLIEIVENQIKTLQRIKKALMEKYFTEGVFEHKEFKETKIGRIPKEWKVKRLREVIQKFQYGLSKKFSDYGEYPILKMDNQNEHNIYLNLKNIKFIDLSQEEIKKYALEYGDILINRTNSIDLVGKVSIFNLQNSQLFVFASYLIRLKPNKTSIYPEFLAYILSWERIQKRLKNIASRSVSQANINVKNLSNILIPCPPLPEQKEIARRLKEIDEFIENRKEKKEHLTKVKKKMMDLLLTGKVRIKEC